MFLLFRMGNGVSQENRIKLMLMKMKTRMKISKRLPISPLHLSAEAGNTPLLTSLIRRGSNVNRRTDGSHGHTTALILAATHGHTECVKVLLEAGANPNATDDWENTALFKAASYNHLLCVIELLNHNADPNSSNHWGALPLQYAALQGHHEVIAALLSSGADVNRAGEPDIMSALAVAASRGHTACVELLLHAQADVNYEWNQETKQTALSESVNYFVLSCMNDISSDSSVTLSDRVTSICFLLAVGAKITPNCFKYFLQSDIFDYEDVLELLKLLIKAVPLGENNQTINHTFDNLLLQLLPENDKDMFIIMSAEFRQNIVKDLYVLMQSIGYRPSSFIKLRMSMFTADPVEESTPRTLQDFCRLTVRARCQPNVLCTAGKLPLPVSLQEWVAC